MDTTTRLPTSKCLDCGKTVTAATPPKGAKKPKPDDFTVCLYCGHVMAFDSDMTVRALTDAEMHEVAGNPEILRIQRARSMVTKK